MRIESYHAQTLAAGEYTLTGEIEECTVGETYCRLTLKEVTADKKELDGKVSATLYIDGSQAKEGMIIRFRARVEPMGKAYRYNAFRADMVLGNIKYSAFSSATPVIENYAKNLFTFARNRVKEVLYDNLSAEQASLAYALTTGNTQGIEEGLLTSVRYGGVAHLFAVSGLHIGVVYAALAFLCKKLKTPKIVQALLPIAFTFLFSGVCGFSASSLRAFFICAAVAVCSLLGLRADGVEGAAFACGLILLLNPVYLFSLGFQLSAAAYTAIVLFSPALQRLFAPVYRKYSRLKTPLQSLAVMLSVQFFLFPVMLNAFGYVSVWGLLLNLLMIPLFSLYFPLLLAGVLLSCLFPTAAFVILFLPAAALSVFAAFFYAVDFSALIIKGFSLGMVGLFSFFALLLSLSGRLNIKGKSNAFFSPISCFLAALVAFDVFAFSLLPADDCRVIQSTYYDDFCCALMQTEEADILLINGKINAARVQTLLYRHGARLNAVIVAAENKTTAVNSVLGLPFETLYINGEENLHLRTKQVVTQRDFSLGGIRFSFADTDTVVFTYQGVKGVFNGTGYAADFTLFSEEARDGLIFRINRGILSVSR